MPTSLEAGTNSNRASPAPEPFKGEAMTVSTREIHEDNRVVSRNANERNVNMVDGPISIQVASSFEIVQTVEIARKTKKRIIRDVPEVTEDDFKLINLQYYLDFIGDERLIHMPARGSDWDRVLTAAEYFGVQVHEFTIHVSRFIREHEFICDTALASCYFLLQVNTENRFTGVSFDLLGTRYLQETS